MNKFSSIMIATVVFAGLAAGIWNPAEAGEPEDLDHDALSVGYESSWHLFGGVTAGSSFESTGRGPFVGTQLSLVRLKHGRWLGMYAEGQYTFGFRSFMTTVGPEFGYKYGGIDAGLATRFGGGHTTFGPQGRLIATVGIFSLIGRYVHWPEFDEHTFQLGVVIKGPLIAPWGFDPF